MVNHSVGRDILPVVDSSIMSQYSYYVHYLNHDPARTLGESLQLRQLTLHVFSFTTRDSSIPNSRHYGPVAKLPTLLKWSVHSHLPETSVVLVSGEVSYRCNGNSDNGLLLFVDLRRPRISRSPLSLPLLPLYFDTATTPPRLHSMIPRLPTDYSTSAR